MQSIRNIIQFLFTLKGASKQIWAQRHNQYLAVIVVGGHSDEMMDDFYNRVEGVIERVNKKYQK